MKTLYCSYCGFKLKVTRRRTGSYITAPFVGRCPKAGHFWNSDSELHDQDIGVTKEAVETYDRISGERLDKEPDDPRKKAV